MPSAYFISSPAPQFSPSFSSRYQLKGHLLGEAFPFCQSLTQIKKIFLWHLSVFIHSTHTHFLSTYSVPCTVSGTEDTSEWRKKSMPWQSYILSWEKMTKRRNK